MKPREINLMGGLLSLCREAKFLIVVPYVFKIKSPLGTQKFLDADSSRIRSFVECVAKF